MNTVDQFLLLFRLAARSLVAHKIKSAIVGVILIFGTFLVASGSALLDSIETSMEQSITSSMSGQFQVYDAKAKDELSLFGGFAFGSTDIGEIADFPIIEKSLLEVEGVKAVVPMGITIATVFGGNEIDDVLEQLRKAVRDGKQEDAATLVTRVRTIAETIDRDYGVRAEITSDPEKVARERESLKQVLTDEFWSTFTDQPAPILDFLDAHIAPLAADGRLLYLRVIGTDPQQFKENFDRFYIVDGEMIPPGQRGVLLSKRTYEKLIKNLVARDFDAIYKDWKAGTKIAEDTLMQERIGRNARQYQRVLFQLPPQDAAQIETAIRKEMPGFQGDMPAALQAFLTVDDSNIESRYKLFYELIAPKISLYEIAVGDDVILRGFTKSGYIKSARTKIWGTYEFKGLERSDLAGASNLMDLATWRELYGKMSENQKAELAAIQQKVGVEELSREDAEAALFGGGGSIEATAVENSGFDEFAAAALGSKEELSTTYDPKTLHEGLALNAAILLDDPTQASKLEPVLKAKIEADSLGIQLIDWATASGLVGQFILVMRLILYVAIFVIFLVALVIINNAMVMATLERTPEIGTIRAIGAQRPFVMGMFLIEMVLLGLIAGGIGGLLSCVVVNYLGYAGIPAGSDILVVLFAGERLFPVMTFWNVAFGVGSVIFVSVLSTLYPAWVAAKVPPIVAMQGKE